MDIFSEYEQCIAERKEEVERAVFDQLIIFSKKRPDAVNAVLSVALVALQKGTFNNYRPVDYKAWDVVAHPVRVAVDFEFVRLHLLAVMYERLSVFASDQLLLDAECKVATKLVP